ncbi:helix-turn-helix transcriptional regulator [uncultured Mucilaginibacter sp.]|uniref:ArsR/SmtB family transcription factor n=1 Tax=uncultured Mucilaginibacter sp. TaxID=797541 RepID=UPI0025F86D8B|nr:helix-turn-helix transcriptional regulator [uncultured Mucilaginibacter sp.]
MNFTRASSSITDEELAHFARAIAIPVRVTILRAMLQERDWLCAGSFIAIPFTLASIENNLLAMKKAGLLEMRYIDRIPHYRLNEIYLNLCSQRFADLMNLSCTGYLPQ